MTLIECEGSVVCLLSPRLLNDHLIFIELPLIGRVDQIVVVLIASTLFGVLAAIYTFAKCGPPLAAQVLLYSHLLDMVLVEILPGLQIKGIFPYGIGELRIYVVYPP